MFIPSRHKEQAELLREPIAQFVHNHATAPTDRSALDELIHPKTYKDLATAIQSPYTTTAPSHEDSVSTPESRKSIFSFKLFRDALTESTATIVSQIKKGAHALLPSTFGKAAAASAASIGFCSLLATKPDWAIGLLAVSIIIRAGSFKENHHLRAQNSVGQLLFATHAALIGAWPAVIGSGFAATRNLVQGLTPEDRPDVRLAISLTGFAIGATVFTSCIGVYPLNQLSNLPLVAMVLTTAAEAFTKKLSWATRLCYLASSSVMLPYHALMSGSLFGVMVNLLSAPNTMRAIWKHDIKPVAGNAMGEGITAPYSPIGQEVSVRTCKTY